MNSKLWIRKALSMCLMVAVLATYSMVALANSDKVVGELTVKGSNLNDESSFVTVNGEAAKSGRSIFSSSIIATSENAGAVINLGKSGIIELAPGTTLSLTFDEKTVSGDLTAGKLTVLGTMSGVNVKTAGGQLVKLNAGESVLASGKAQDDDDNKKGGAAWWAWALIFGGAAAGILIAASQSNNETALSGSGTVLSPTR